MKQATFTVKYDEEKLNAIRQYMGKKNVDFEGELVEAVGKCMKSMFPRRFGSTSRAEKMRRPPSAGQPDRRQAVPEFSAIRNRQGAGKLPVTPCDRPCGDLCPCLEKVDKQTA